MKTKLTLALIALGLVALGLTGGYWLAKRPMADMNMSADANPGGAAPASADKKPLYYYDPMYPQQKFDKPGKSPFMDMMLVPVYGDGGEDNGSVKISSRIVQNLGIRTVEVMKGPLNKKLEAVGTVAFDERAVAVVQARTAGFIEKLYVRAPLDPVTKGQPVAQILAPDWVAAQEEYLALRKSPQADAALKAAARQRLVVMGMAEDTITQVEADGKPRARITLVAPISGVIGELGTREGATVTPGMLLFRINGLATVWVNAEVPESQASEVTPGSAITASVAGYPGEILKGKVAALLPDVNAMTRTLKARIELANPKGQLKPGMFANINFMPGSLREVLMVPTEAIIATGQRTVVIAADMAQGGKQAFAPIDVEIGAEANGMTEIRKGLERGMRVVASGQFLIDSEASLKSTGTRMSEAPSMEMHKGEGRVEKVGPNGVTISHGPIRSMQMGAMTMEFQSTKVKVPDGVKEGNNVAFEFMQNKQGQFELTKIEPKTGAAK
jgi:membrane fusion protein, copper/silver efflux system